MTHRPATAPRSAFTLIELLVVISIIALLISLLLPALGRSRETARTVVCASTQRQMGLAIINYTTEHNSYYPRPFEGSDGSPGVPATQRGSALWFNAIDFYMDVPRKPYTSNDNTQRNVLQFKQDPVWSEPSIAAASMGQPLNYTIKMSEYFASDLPAPSPGVLRHARESDLKRGKPIVLLVDGRAQDILAADAGSAASLNASPGLVGLRHGSNRAGVAFSGSANVTFTDGATRLITQQVRTSTAAPSWETDTATNQANGRQILAWRLNPP